MADRPILFSGVMVRAIIDGRKTQTRRVLKPRGQCSLFDGTWSDDYVLDPDNAEWRQRDVRYTAGDRLWVRETWRLGRGYDGASIKNVPSHARVWHDADDSLDNDDVIGRQRRPSIYMPRWASRLTLVVDSVKVERVQDISEADACAEGVESPDTEREDHDWSICPKCGGTRLYTGLGPNLGVMPDCDCFDCDTYAKRFRHLWNSINADPKPVYGPGKQVISYVSYPWGGESGTETHGGKPRRIIANPWVAAVTFAAHHCNIDDLPGPQVDREDE